jgi:hypothetical protein
MIKLSLLWHYTTAFDQLSKNKHVVIPKNIIQINYNKTKSVENKNLIIFNLPPL